MKPAVGSFLEGLTQVFNRKTIRGFVERPETIAGLESPFRRLFQDALDPGCAPLSILTAPAQSILVSRSAFPWLPSFLLPWEITPERCLALTPDCLWVASAPYGSSEAPRLTPIPLAEILALEIGCVLLNAWFEWTAAAAGRLERTRVHFNAVGRPLVEQFSARVRAARFPPGPAPLTPPPRRSDLLAGLPYRFQNLAPRLLFAGEDIEAVAFSPASRPRRGRPALPDVLLLRTPAYLIAAREEPSPGGRYGLVCQFIPLAGLRGAAFTPSGLDLTLVRGPLQAIVSLPFAAAAQPQARSLLAPLPGV